jgi:hypothetical protein
LSERASTHKALWAANFLGSTSNFTFHFEPTMGCSSIIGSVGYTDLVIGKLTELTVALASAGMVNAITSVRGLINVFIIDSSMNLILV